MNPKSPDFLFFITAATVYRVMHDGGTVEFPRLPGQPAQYALAKALEGLRRKKRVLVFSQDAWCQTLELSAAQLNGLSAEELSAVLAFEAEAFSGLPAQQAQTAYSVGKAQDETLPCRIMQMSKTDVGAIQQAVRNAHGRLLGISHPAFLESAEDAAEGAGIELWMRNYLRLIRRGESVPAIQPAEAELSAADRAKRMAVPLAAAAVLCLAIHGVTQFRLNRAEKSLAGLSRLQAQYEQVARQTQDITQRTRQMRQEHAEELQRQNRIMETRAYLATLLGAIADRCPAQVMIQRLEPAGGAFGVLLEGLGATPKDTDEFLVALGRELTPFGWSVAPQEVTAQHLLTDSGPWRFSFLLTRAAEDSP